MTASSITLGSLPRPSWLPPPGILARKLAVGLHSTRYRMELAECVFRLMPATGACTVLDVGAGDGRVSAVLRGFRPSTAAFGLETVIRTERETGLPMARFDGVHVPLADASVDVTLLLNVLHHAKQPQLLLGEIVRITRQRIVIKDHLASNKFQRWQLALLDVVGNWGSGASVRGSYWSRQQWCRTLAELGARPTWLETLPFRAGMWRWLFPNELEVMLVIDR